MDCSAAIAALAAAREGLLPPDRELALHAHLALCQACRTAWARQEHLRPLADDDTPPDHAPAGRHGPATSPALAAGSPDPGAFDDTAPPAPWRDRHAAPADATSPATPATVTNPASPTAPATTADATPTGATPSPAWPPGDPTPPGNATPATLPPPPHQPRPARPPIRRLSLGLSHSPPDLPPLPNVSGEKPPTHPSAGHEPPATSRDAPGETSPTNLEESGPQDFTSWTDTLGWLLVCVLGLWVLFGADGRGGGRSGRPNDPPLTATGPTPIARHTPEPAPTPPATPGPTPTTSTVPGPTGTPLPSSRETASRSVFQVGEAMVLVEGDAQVAVFDDTLTILGGKGKMFLVGGRRAVLRLGSSTPVLRELPLEFDLPPASLPGPVASPPAAPVTAGP